MTAMPKQQIAVDVSELASQLGRRGGRPRGSLSSPLSIWLREEVRQRKREGYGCRDAFDVMANIGKPAGRDAFIVTDYTADNHGLDIGARVNWDYFKKLWKKSRD